MHALEFRYSNLLHHGLDAKVELKKLAMSCTLEVWEKQFLFRILDEFLLVQVHDSAFLMGHFISSSVLPQIAFPQPLFPLFCASMHIRDRWFIFGSSCAYSILWVNRGVILPWTPKKCVSLKLLLAVGLKGEEGEVNTATLQLTIACCLIERGHTIRHKWR